MIGSDAAGYFVLVTGAAFEEAHGGQRCQKPGKFGDFGDIGLAEEEGFFWVEAAGEEIERDVHCIAAAFGGVEERRHRMVVGDEIEGFAFVLQFDGRLHHPEIVAHVQRTGGLDAGQNSHAEKLKGFPVWTQPQKLRFFLSIVFLGRNMF